MGAIPMQTTIPDDALCKKSASRPRILVVEDDMGMGRALALTLNRVGCEAKVVGTVSEARKQLAHLAAWDGLILDLCLPDGPGLGVLAWVRAKGPDFPVLIHTGHSEHDAISDAFDLQAWYLEKPSTARQIERFVRFVRARVQECSGPPQPIDSEDLAEDLRKLAGDALAAASHLEQAEVEASYRLALLARAANGRHCGRHSAMEACARAARVSRQALQEYGAVTARWEPSKVKQLLGQRDGHGRRIRISHLLRIARASGASRGQLERVIGPRSPDVDKSR
jgi:DNA-binding response OmpR family regulator